MRCHISAHNKAVLEGQEQKPLEECKCRGHPCPLDGECNIENIAHLAQAHITDDNKNVLPGKSKEYTGQTIHFKDRWYQHNNSFNDPKKELTRLDKVTKEPYKVSIAEQIEEKKNKSELAKYIWSLKEKGKKYAIKWSVAKKARPYKNGMRFCDLCLTEKTLIALSDPDVSLNKRNEILRKCTHKPRFKLSHKTFKPP